VTQKETDVQNLIGWDIGGAHVKAARIEAGRVVDVRQLPCPLWQGADRLTPVLETLRSAFGSADLHIATMTGELADIFPDRRTGVLAIVDALVRALPQGTLRLYAGPHGLIAPALAASHIEAIASANWHASAALAARYGDALFVDIGSTTTDIVPLQNGGVHARGYTDADRLASGELVYTGLTRSFVMALAPRAPFAGRWTTLAAEYFASAADVHRILDTLHEAADQMDTADGRPKTVGASRARLARMIGQDAADASDADWHALAAWFSEVQLRQIHDGALLVLSGAGLPPDAPVITAGVGALIGQRLADRLGRRSVPFARWVEARLPSDCSGGGGQSGANGADVATSQGGTQGGSIETLAGVANDDHETERLASRARDLSTGNPLNDVHRGLDWTDACAPAVAVALLAADQPPA
jgi:probable H4MPT-linked C1 transfer pathway protein